MSLKDEFDYWWSQYPREGRVGKLATRKKYEKARKDGATEAQLLDGLERYKRTKPGWKAWCHAQTFLNQGRYLDEPQVEQIESTIPASVMKQAREIAQRTGGYCSHTPPCEDYEQHLAVIARRLL